MFCNTVYIKENGLFKTQVLNDTSMKGKEFGPPPIVRSIQYCMTQTHVVACSETISAKKCLPDSCLLFSITIYINAGVLMAHL